MNKGLVKVFEQDISYRGNVKVYRGRNRVRYFTEWE